MILGGVAIIWFCLSY